MKLIVAGATGFVGKEVIRQSLKRSDITTVIALSRSPFSPEDGADISKLRNVIIEDYGDYSDSVKKEFAGADACIWTVAITPVKSKGVPFEEVKRVCQTCAITGLRTMHESGVKNPFRFIYISGSTVPRDASQRPTFIAEYLLMRGEAENMLLRQAAESNGAIDVCVAKPGWITDGKWGRRNLMAIVMRMLIRVKSVAVEEIAAAMLESVVKGFEKEPLGNEDLVEVGRRVLSASPEEGS